MIDITNNDETTVAVKSGIDNDIKSQMVFTIEPAEREGVDGYAFEIKVVSILCPDGKTMMTESEFNKLQDEYEPILVARKVYEHELLGIVAEHMNGVVNNFMDDFMKRAKDKLKRNMRMDTDIELVKSGARTEGTANG